MDLTYTLAVCVCGYRAMIVRRDKPFVATPKELRRLRKHAKAIHFHFADGITNCPQCGREIDFTADKVLKLDGTPNGDGEEYGREIARIDQQTMFIKTIKDGTQSVRNATGNFSTLAKSLTGLFALARENDLNVREPVTELVEAIDVLRHQMNAFADEVTSAARDVTAEEREQPGNGELRNHG